jgi:hypothetical protein
VVDHTDIELGLSVGICRFALLPIRRSDISG